MEIKTEEGQRRYEEQTKRILRFLSEETGNDVTEADILETGLETIRFHVKYGEAGEGDVDVPYPKLRSYLEGAMGEGKREEEPIPEQASRSIVLLRGEGPRVNARACLGILQGHCYEKDEELEEVRAQIEGMNLGLRFMYGPPVLQAAGSDSPWVCQMRVVSADYSDKTAGFTFHFAVIASSEESAHALLLEAIRETVV